MDERVFISYSRKDAARADKIKVILESNGIPCWMDRAGISVGEKYTREIISAIKQCEIFLLVLSPNAEQSEWVPKELGVAIQNHKYIIPVRITDFTVEEFELQLENIQIFEADRLPMDEMENGLVSTIRSVLRLNTEAKGSAGAEPVNRPSVQADQPRKQKADKKKLIVPIAAAAVVLIVIFIILGRAFKSPEDEEIAAISDATETSESAVTSESVEEAEEPMDDGAVQKSIEELLRYVEQAEELVKQANAETDEFADLEDFTETDRSVEKTAFQSGGTAKTGGWNPQCRRKI